MLANTITALQADADQVIEVAVGNCLDIKIDGRAIDPQLRMTIHYRPESERPKGETAPALPTPPKMVTTYTGPVFALAPEEIDVLVHPQSIVHGMVEFSDCSVVAQLGAPDMRTPIAHCLGWPDRIKGPAAKLDLAKIGQLTFEAPDFERFPALRIAYEALRTGRGATTVFNAANEVAVAAFIAGKIRFGAIARLVEATIDAWIRSGNLAPLTSADDAIAVDHNARNKAAALLPQIALKAS